MNTWWIRVLVVACFAVAACGGGTSTSAGDPGPDGTHEDIFAVDLLDVGGDAAAGDEAVVADSPRDGDPGPEAIPDPGTDPGAEADPDPGTEPTPEAGDAEPAADIPADDSAAEAPDTQPDTTDPCLAQDAGATGNCEAIVAGFRWDGRRCTSLGTGCACAGADCGAVYATVEACVAARRACYEVGCEPQAAAGDGCATCGQTSFFGVFWDGRECFDLTSCGCRGAACAGAFASMDECVAVQATCDSTACLATGGLWFPADAGLCGMTCGEPSPLPCAMDTCDCGPGRNFVTGKGCADDPSCAPDSYCRATRGTWHPASECICGYTCGVKNGCKACLDSCDCGPDRNFVAGEGCAVDAACSAASLEQLCTSTGGTWQSGESCGNYVCGTVNTADPCVTPGCDCGWIANFDPAKGCVLDDGCMMRQAGEDCSSGGSCRAGLVCCQACGMAPGCARCQDPCCPTDPYCFDGCPPPPP